MTPDTALSSRARTSKNRARAKALGHGRESEAESARAIRYDRQRMIVSLVLILAGIVILAVAGDRLVDFAVVLARRARVTPAVIGLTILAAGTSMPELFVSATAAFGAATDIALANVVGSNTANLGLILGVAALISPLPMGWRVLKFEYPVMLLSAWILLLLARDGLFDRLEAGSFLIAMAAFVAYAVWVAHHEASEADGRRLAQEVEGSTGRVSGWPVWALALGLVAALIALALGARLLVQGAVWIALALGMTERVVGLTVVAVGTSLPELVATLAAAAKRQHEMALANIVGSNIFNVLMILGVSGLLRPMPVGPRLIVPDMAVMVGFSLLLIPLVVRDQRITRAEGLLLFVAYVVYVGWLLV